MWNHNGCGDGEDGSAFIFSLDNKTKFNVKPVMKKYAIYCNSSLGPTFGNDGDIVIKDNCNTATNNYSCFGNYYTLPAGMSKYTDESESYLAGSQKFKVKEIEVFQII
jgi:hypothetical protein